MLSGNTDYIKSYTTPVRQMGVVVYLKEDGNASTLDMWSNDSDINSMTYERIGIDNKFFGYGVCQKVNLKIRDKERAINPTTN